MAVLNQFQVLVCVVPSSGADVGSAYRVNWDPFNYLLKLYMPHTAAAASSKKGE
jgi:hypothetical protein